jgi:iron complex transport system substrate-binding protein
MDYSEDPTFFHQLKAVKEGQLYQWPNSTWHWSNVEIPLVTAYYVGALLYPEAFDDIEFEKKTAEIFELFLNKSDYLSILEKEDVGYKKVILGE